MTLIVDCSNFQGKVDWKAVLASGRVGGIAKATEGLSYVDPFFAGNWSTLKSLGATRGAYHFARPDNTVAMVQADKFLSVVTSTKADDILVLDLEVGTGELSAWALEWLTRVQAKTGIKPWLYSYAPFIRAHLHDPRLANYPLWLAAYQTAPPPCPPPWTSYVLWQHTDKANVPGVAGPCDESTGTLTVPPPVPASGGPDMATVIGALADPQVPGGIWVFAADGGVFTYNGARYLGSFPGLPPEGRQGGPRTFVSATANSRAGYDLHDSANETYSFP